MESNPNCLRKADLRIVEWTAVVPLKRREHRKSRLAPRLPAVQRLALADDMARHVISCLANHTAVRAIHVLSPERPTMDRVIWSRDEAEDLNESLTAFRATLGGRPLLIIHADLPLLSSDDVRCLLMAAESAGIAIAPDRHTRGTNAIAIRDGREFAFHFGQSSFSQHLVSVGRACTIVRRPGLLFDLDTPEDLDLIESRLLPSPA